MRENTAIRITKPAKVVKTPPRRFDPNNQPGRQYVPRTHLGPYWGVGLRYAYDGVPPFLPIRDVPRMQVDDTIAMAVGMRSALILQSQFEVECNDESAKAWIKATVKTAWNRLVPQMLVQYFYWGYSCCLPSYIQDPDNPGFVDLVGGRMVTPTLGQPHIWTDGPYTGQFYGIDLAAASGVLGLGWMQSVNPPERTPSRLAGAAMGGSAAEDSMIPTPWAMWFGGNESECPLYDRSPLAVPYEDWLEKCMRGGAEDTRRTYFRRAAIPAMLWRVPLGRLDPDDPNSPTNMEWAAYLVASLENNSNLIVPDARAAGMEGRTEPQWAVESAGAVTQSVDVLGYIDHLDRKILKGFHIPPEVLDESGSGAGYSGRQVPQQTLYSFTDQLAAKMLDVINFCILREVVPHNFGERCRWRLNHIPMLEAVRRMEQQGTVDPDEAAAQGIDLPPPTGDPEQGSPHHAGADDPRAKKEGSNLVPYVGTRGGVGKKNVVTGRITYEPLSNAAVQTTGNRTIANLSVPGVAVEEKFGCLMAKCPAAFAAKVRKLAESIDAADLAEDGVEGDTHVTIRYGLREADGSAVFSALGDPEPCEVECGPLGCFRSPEHDVLYISCKGKPALHKWNKVVDESGLDMAEPTFAEYVPHVTVAYLKPGRAEEYLKGKGLTGVKWVADELEYHRPDGKVDRTELWPGTESLKAMLLGAA
jgi:2'-5' RNA ligase